MTDTQTERLTDRISTTKTSLALCRTVKIHIGSIVLFTAITTVQLTFSVRVESYVIYDGRRFYFRDDGCHGKTTLGATAELHYEQNVDAYVGMPCSAGLQTMSH